MALRVLTASHLRNCHEIEYHDRYFLRNSQCVWRHEQWRRGLKTSGRVDSERAHSLVRMAHNRTWRARHRQRVRRGRDSKCIQRRSLRVRSNTHELFSPPNRRLRAIAKRRPVRAIDLDRLRGMRARNWGIDCGLIIKCNQTLETAGNSEASQKRGYSTQSCRDSIREYARG